MEKGKKIVVKADDSPSGGDLRELSSNELFEAKKAFRHLYPGTPVEEWKILGAEDSRTRGPGKSRPMVRVHADNKKTGRWGSVAIEAVG